MTPADDSYTDSSAHLKLLPPVIGLVLEFSHGTIVPRKYVELGGSKWN